MPESDPTNPPCEPELHGLDPGELLARGMNTVRFSGTMHDWTPPTPEELARLLPQYQIESLIGRGGMGAVYKGFQQKLGRPVAIKVLPAELSADKEFVTRFEREARTLAKLQHPGIVAIYDFGQTSGEHLYFVMEYVDGTDLRRIMQGPGLEPAQALEIIVQICEALQATHRQGVIHRDIKPANILITADGRVKLADFGLARPNRDEHEGMTLSNVVLGTPDYMAPEQRAGLPDHRTDIFALGLMLYEMLTGQLPRGAWVPPSRKVQVDVRIDEVVIKALQEEPDLRYQQASEMKTDVDNIRSGAVEPPQVPPPKPRRAVAWSAIAAAAAALAVAAIWLLEKREASGQSQPPLAQETPIPAEPSAGEMPHPAASPASEAPADSDESPENAGKPWTPELDTELRNALAGGERIKNIAERMRRTRGAIVARMKKLGIADPTSIPAPSPDTVRETAAAEADNTPASPIRIEKAPPSQPGPPLSSLDEALFANRWDYLEAKLDYKFSHSLFFQPDGFAYSIGRNTQWRFVWTRTGPRSLHLERSLIQRGGMDITFDEKFERFSGKYADGSTVEGRRTRTRSPEDTAMLERIISKFPAASTAPGTQPVSP